MYIVKTKVGPWSSDITIKSGVTKYEITGLEVNTFYEIDIVARNELGKSPDQPYRIKTMTGSGGK
jgi:hypothetical protein